MCNLLQRSFSSCVFSFTFLRWYTRKIRSTRQVMTSSRRSRTLVGSAESREILLHHYDIFSEDRCKAPDTGRKKLRKLEARACTRNTRSICEEQLEVVTMKLSSFLNALDEACIGSLRRAIGCESAFGNNDALFVFRR